MVKMFMKMPEVLKTAIIFLMVFCCLCVASVVSVRAEVENVEKDNKENRTPGYDAKYVSDVLKKEIGVGFARRDEISTFQITEGNVVYVEIAESIPNSVEVVRYEENGNWTVIHGWNEGLAKANGEPVYCADAMASFCAGNKTAYNALLYYNQNVIDMIGTLMALYDEAKQEKFPNHLSHKDDYMIKQCIVWLVLNEVHGWYPGCNIEYGNGVTDAGGDSVLSHFRYVENELLQKAKDPKVRKRYRCSALMLVGDGQYMSQWFYEKIPQKIKVELNKLDDVTNTALAQGAATLEGATYEIYDQRNQLVDTLTTDKVGKAVSKALPLGVYKIKETHASQGYLLDPQTYTVDGSQPENTISEVVTYRLTSKETIITGGVKVQKRDYDTKDASPQGGASFENADFSVISLNENPIVVKGKTYQKGETVVVIQTDENGLAQTADNILPYGEYCVKETGAPTGYLGTGIVSRNFSVHQDGVMVDMTDPDHSIQNRVKRGDFEIRKIDSETQDKMENVQFMLTSVTTGESHPFTTDENGYYSSSAEWNKHTYQTNQGGKEDGLWFGMDSEGKSAPVDDTLGALPYDTYIIEEISSDANQGKEMFKGTLVIYKNGVSVNLGNIENHRSEEKNPSISTTAANKMTGDHYAEADDTVTIVDTVLYDGVTAGEEYVIKGVLMNKSTGTAVTDADGTPVMQTKTFVAAATAGMEELEYTFSASELGGCEVVVFEELYYRDEIIAEHRDMNDKEQTIKIKERPKEPENPENPKPDTKEPQKTVKTGDSITILCFVLLAVSEVLMLIAIIALKKGSKRR